jgi:hypothetical protein
MRCEDVGACPLSWTRISGIQGDIALSIGTWYYFLTKAREMRMNTYKTEEVIMTRFNIGATLLVIAAILLVSNCSKDSDGKGSTAPKADILIYGLLGSRPHWVDPDSSLFWAYARVFDHPDHQNVEAELVHDTTVISLEANYHDSEKFFSEGQSFFSFEPDEEYTFRAWDLNRSYSGTITTLPQIRIINNTVISNQITLQWTDVGADFYDVGFLDWGNFEKHYQVKDTLFAIDIDSLPFYSGIIDIDIGGFKGFNPMSHPGGNIQGCYGYLFGYTMDETVLDMTTMTFSKPSFHEIPPDLDDLMLFFFDNKVTTQRDYSYEDPEFMFTYARIDNWGYSSSSFSSITIVEPANSISSIEGYLNGIQLDGYIWAGFYSVFRTWDDLYLTYDKDMLFTYTLALNNMLDSATVANPDTFSMLTHPPEDTIPEVPLRFVGIGQRMPISS